MTLSEFAWRLYRESEEGTAAIQRSIAEHAEQYVTELGDSPFDAQCLISVPDENGNFQYEGQTVVDLHDLIGNHCDLKDVCTPDGAEPLLHRLGFAETDWRYQMRVRMGRGERNVPDYVLGVDETPGEELAIALIEAKYDIGNAKERKEAFIQAKSYAMRLNATVLVLAARQGLWLYKLTSRGFDEDQHLYKTWSELASPDKFAEVDRLIGKRKIDAGVAERERRRRRTGQR